MLAAFMKNNTKKILIALTLIGSLAWGHKHNVTLDVTLEVDHHVINGNPMTVPLGQRSTSELKTDQGTYVIEVVPKEDIDNQVYLDFTLKKITNGKALLISHPRVITLNNQQAIIEEGDSATSDAKDVVLSVTPHL